MGSLSEFRSLLECGRSPRDRGISDRTAVSLWFYFPTRERSSTLVVQDKLFRIDQGPQNIADTVQRTLSYRNRFL